MKNIFSISLLFLTVLGCNSSNSQNNHDPITKWAQSNAIRIESLEFNHPSDDLNALKDVVGDSDVVCLGESRHDIHEQFRLKHYFIKYLIEEMGFRTFVLEASLPYSHLINDYLLHGDGNLAQIMAGMPGWFLWDTQEMTAILAWIRTYNLDPTHKTKVHFYGIDIVAPNYALTQIFEFLKKVDDPYYEKIRNTFLATDIIEDNYWPNTLQHFAAMEMDQKQKLQINYSELYNHLFQNKTQYIVRTSEKEYNWVLRLTYCAREAIRMFSAERRMEIGLIRDQAMAENTSWIKHQLKNKMIIWAHNVHIAKSTFTMSGEEGDIEGMGCILSKNLKNNMVSIGATFNQGVFKDANRRFEPAEQNTLEGLFARLNMNYFLIDLKAPANHKKVSEWLNTNHRIRGQDFEMTCIPGQAFDAIYFTNQISKVQFNPETLEKLRN